MPLQCHFCVFLGGGFLFNCLLYSYLRLLTYNMKVRSKLYYFALTVVDIKIIN